MFMLYKIFLTGKGLCFWLEFKYAHVFRTEDEQRMNRRDDTERYKMCRENGKVTVCGQRVGGRKILIIPFFTCFFWKLATVIRESTSIIQNIAFAI